MRNNAGSGTIYGMGLIGSLIYFMQHASTFLEVIIGIIMALFWPAVIVYKVLGLLNL